MSNENPETAMAAGAAQDHSIVDSELGSQGFLDPSKGKEGGCEVKRMDSKAAKTVWIWKIAVLSLIIVTAAVVAGGAHHFLSQKEEDDYQDAVSSGYSSG